MSKAAPMQIVRSGYPMELIAVDILLGEFPITENGNKYILVIGDISPNGLSVLLCPTRRHQL